MPEQDQQTPLLELEEERKAIARARLWSIFCIATGLLIVLGCAITGIFMPGGILIGAADVVAGAVQYYRISGKIEQYALSFKQKVIYAALLELDPGLQIQPNNGLRAAEFTSSGLFDQEPERMHSEDQVSGRAGDTAFRFSEVHAEYKTVTQTKNGRQEHWHTIFRGVIFTAGFNKNFRGFTVVRPRDTGNAVLAWIAKNMPLLSAKSDELVQLESPGFCKEFVTYSTDQVEARYILTPAMMERLCELNSRSRYTLSLSFSNNNMYLAFPLDNDYFEPPLFKSLLRPDLLADDIDLIRFMIGIVSDLDLDTRIWGKEKQAP